MATAHRFNAKLPSCRMPQLVLLLVSRPQFMQRRSCNASPKRGHLGRVSLRSSPRMPTSSSRLSCWPSGTSRRDLRVSALPTLDSSQLGVMWVGEPCSGSEFPTSGSAKDEMCCLPRRSVKTIRQRCTLVEKSIHSRKVFYSCWPRKGERVC